ncbi:methyl-accepting chemotaxis protein [Paraburkholderia sp. J8-2]|uniref:methyl-accepting chemotaxis protein n=1 Tax=Paraburkholderia sp. J8-2 TaxID=2805440 RepID=UPI002AB66727|nr:methyl-accepting chemotaxis protein [Paraburkholderia sp. J8-2]
MKKKIVTIKFKLLLTFGLLAAILAICAVLAALAAQKLDAGSQSPPQLWLGIIIAVASTGAVFAVYFSVHLHRVVCGGLLRMAHKFEEVATTLDLSRRSASPRADEFGRAAIAFDKLMRRVEEAMAVVHVSSNSVSTAAKEIAFGNLDLSARTEQQAASLQETAASMLQLTETVKRNTDSARTANGLASDAHVMADAAGQVVRVMLDAIERIDSTSKKVSEITSVIESIAFQTNILALNAAVEAARAGEQGRGFSVVAAEVRVLAQRSTLAAREINEVIASSVSTVHESTRHALEVSSAMDKMQSNARRVAGIVDEIAVASEEQSRGIEQINTAVVQMDQVTQQNAALVEQAATAAHSLETHAMKLQEAVSAFTLADTAVGDH